MGKTQITEQQLIELLAKADFHKRYYDFIDKAKRTAGKEKCTYQSFCEVISEDTRCKHHKSERFFQLRETDGQWEFTLKLAYCYGKLELIMSGTHNGKNIGGVVTRLALESARVLDPEFMPKPLAPKIPFSTQAELREAVAFSVSLYEVMKSAILTFTSGS